MLQQVIVGLIVAAAAVFIARRVWGTLASARLSAKGASAGGCDSGCGCAPPASARTDTPSRG